MSAEHRQLGLTRAFSLAVLSLLAGLVATAWNAGARASSMPDHWVGTWATAQQLSPNVAPAGAKPPPQAASTRLPPSPIPPTPEALKNQTVRMVVRASLGGREVRVQLSNAQGMRPLLIGAAHIARCRGGSSIVGETDHAITFGGRAVVTIPPGAILVSDPVSLPVAQDEDLTVSLFVPDDSGPVTLHPLGLRTTYIAEGDVTARETLDAATNNRSYFWLSGMDVLTDQQAAAIVAFGDSITDGFSTTPDANRAWPSVLATKLLAGKSPRWSVLNMGISGNRVLRDGAGTSALARFDRDVLSRPGAKWIILLEGINDISIASIPGVPPSEHASAEELISGLRLFVDKAHLHGLRIVGATILPWEGVWTYSQKGEEIRQAVNRWIRTGGAFDHVVDFDAVMRDPAHPTRLRPEFDSGDHVHPNDAGNRAMADAIDLAYFSR